MYTFDEISLLKDKKRWFPIMGEIHYSRYPKKYWKESLLKMKAGGVTIISTYVIWIHHEEIEKEYDFSDSKDLHAFVEVCKECKVKLCLRIGPWIHGEVRNGGFPDWLLKKDFEVRTNDEKYFATVETWYKKIYNQVSDLLWSETCPENPIIAVQIENEYGHCGGLYDETGEIHMQRLQKMAMDIGFNVPLYTATGWGGARTGGMLPVMGGYCDAPWDPRITEIEPSGNYIFTHERNDHNIGSDHGLGEGITFDTTKFPYLTAELGGGLQVCKHRRPVATAKDIASVSLVKMGSGVNLLGYYMYHGGTNPDGKLTTLQESKATGYPNDLPEKNYDFRAPVREYGQISDTLKEIKLLTYFTQDFGEEFCSLPALIPEDNPLKPDNITDLRYAYRTDGKKGYVFINNYVRLRKTPDYTDKVFSLGKTTFPKMNIASGDFFFLPCNITYGDTLVKTAFATPYCVLNNGTTVFYNGKNDERRKDFFDTDKANPSFLVLSRDDALNSWKTAENQLVISDASLVVSEKNENILIGRGKKTFAVYPDFDSTPKGFEKIGEVNKNIAQDLPPCNFSVYEQKETLATPCTILLTEKTKTEDATVYSLDCSALVQQGKDLSVNDCFITLNYLGESANLYKIKEGKRILIADNLFVGENYSWEIGLKKFMDEAVDFSCLELEILSLKKDAPLYLEKWPPFSGSTLNEIKTCTAEFEWQVVI